MGRRLFCELCPLTYKISVEKNIFLRKIKDLFSKVRFARQKSEERLPVVICRHKSLIRRVLGNVDMRLQENKAINLSLSAPCVNKIIINPGETFSFWKLVGNPKKSRGYREGLTISNFKSSSGIGGGMCQFTNLLHWMVLHSPLDIVEHHHHDGFDLFPDFNRQIPFGTGTSIHYNYLDYRFKNNTDQAYQLVVYTTDTHLCGELLSTRPLSVKYHIETEGERFVREGDEVYRLGKVYRTCIDKATGNELSKVCIRENHAKVMYEVSEVQIQEK